MVMNNPFRRQVTATVVQLALNALDAIAYRAAHDNPTEIADELMMYITDLATIANQLGSDEPSMIRIEEALNSMGVMPEVAEEK